MPQRKRANSVGGPDLLFIANAALQKKIENAIETMSVLYLLQNDKKSPESLKKEMRRMIILYAASIIEAALLYLY